MCWTKFTLPDTSHCLVEAAKYNCGTAIVAPAAPYTWHTCVGLGILLDRPHRHKRAGNTHDLCRSGECAPFAACVLRTAAGMSITDDDAVVALFSKHAASERPDCEWQPRFTPCASSVAPPECWALYARVSAARGPVAGC